VSSPSPTPSDLQDEPEGLSSGAKVGIGVASGVAVLAVLAVVVFLFLRKRRQTRAQTRPDGRVELQGSTSQPLEMSWDRDKKDIPMIDVKLQHYQNSPAVEAPGDTYWPGRVYELDSSSVRTYEVSSPTEGATNLSTNTHNFSRIS
jgi:hypothetical protein